VSRILLIGGGGFAKEVHEIADLNGHDVVGYVADVPGSVKLPHLGPVGSIMNLKSQFDHFFVAFGAVDRQSIARRAELIGWIDQLGFSSVALVSPHATISRGVYIAPGALIAHRVVVSVDAEIGAYSVLNTSAVVGHDAIIGARSIVAPCAFVGGAAVIGEDSLLGPNSLVLQGRSVGSKVIISLGSLVMRDIAEGMTVLPVRSKTRR
jgi:acetyltransferase EpsM